MQIETMRVKPWGDDQGEYVVINTEDFDPKIHARFEEQAAKRGRKPKDDTE